MALGVGVEQPSGVVELALEPQSGQTVVAHAVRGEQRQAGLARNVETVPIGTLLLAQDLALWFHLDVSSAENATNRIHVAGQRYVPATMLLDVLQAGSPLPSARAGSCG